MALTGTCWSGCLPGGLCAFYPGVGWGAEAPSLLTLCSAAVASLGPWYQDDVSADGSFVLLGVAGERRESCASSLGFRLPLPLALYSRRLLLEQAGDLSPGQASGSCVYLLP